MQCVCPQCGSLVEASTGENGALACPSCGETMDAAALRAATCPFCCNSFAEEDTVKICPDCKTPHHAECWEDNRGCSTYGCPSAPLGQTHTAGGGTDGNLVPCPACGAMHPATDLVCTACGKLFGGDRPLVLSLASSSETKPPDGEVPSLFWKKLGRNLWLLAKDAAVIWWKEFSRYAEFRGRTARESFLVFALVTVAMGHVCIECHGPWLVLALVLPFLAACVRRLRDTDISPWMVFCLPLLPVLLLVPTVETKSTTTNPEGGDAC